MTRNIYRLLSSFLARKQYVLIRGLVYLRRPRRVSVNRLDYVRLATLELIAQELDERGAGGDIAELGVYQGGFAQHMGDAFPNKTFYLFDTFEGFDKRDISSEQSRGFGDAGQDFSNTSVDAVLRVIPHPARCVVRQGFFPDTFAGLEEKQFCFVSLDADLYDPILEGLRLFYPRLVPGGAIMIHDFNNDVYPGCRKAVTEFCHANRIAWVPIGDIGGSVVLRKP